MFEIKVRESLFIAHSLKDDFFGPAKNLHGATYVVDLIIKSRTLDNHNVVCDIEFAHNILKDCIAKYNYLNLDGVEIRALYGRDSYYINVIQFMISKFKLDRKIIIKKEIDFNEVFADYLVGTPKNLLLHIKNKGSWSLEEQRNEDFILEL